MVPPFLSQLFRTSETSRDRDGVMKCHTLGLEKGKPNHRNFPKRKGAEGIPWSLSWGCFSSLKKLTWLGKAFLGLGKRRCRHNGENQRDQASIPTSSAKKESLSPGKIQDVMYLCVLNISDSQDFQVKTIGNTSYILPTMGTGWVNRIALVELGTRQREKGKEKAN